ncbi:MAG: uracil-DNA glycosylase [Planctomycetaceae bacterium]|jgi:DNA polymerase|nr:uracil-DNA glycosylase [Planctomycetaceae bacterium]
MNKQIQSGLIDYLTIMQYAGVTDVGNLSVVTAGKLPEVVEQIISVTKNNETESHASTTESDKPQTTPQSMTQNKNIDGGAVESGLKNMQVESDLAANDGGDKLSQLKLLSAEVACCTLCSELVRSRTQTVFGTGNPDTRLLFLGEAPGADEDRQGEPFVGRSGKLLNDIITKGMKIKREDVYICNILRCRPPSNRPPEPAEAANCHSFLERTIKIVNPKFICCLGTIATRYLLKSDKSIGFMRGLVHDYNGIKVICTYHPSYLLRSPTSKKDAWEDIKLLMRIMEENE